MEYCSLRLVHFFFYNISRALFRFHEWPVLLVPHYSPASLAMTVVFGHLNISIFSRMMMLAICPFSNLEGQALV